jgi:hypothetical protein
MMMNNYFWSSRLMGRPNMLEATKPENLNKLIQRDSASKKQTPVRP